MTIRRSSPLHGWQARVAAVFLALAGIALMGWLGREQLGQMGLSGLPFPVGQDGIQAASPAKGNPALAACLAERLGTVDKMNSDGILTAAQYDLFRTRAISFCEAEFPPTE